MRVTEKPERTRLEKVTTLLQAVSAVLIPVLTMGESALPVSIFPRLLECR